MFWFCYCFMINEMEYGFYGTPSKFEKYLLTAVLISLDLEPHLFISADKQFVLSKKSYEPYVIYYVIYNVYIFDNKNEKSNSISIIYSGNLKFMWVFFFYLEVLSILSNSTNVVSNRFCGFPEETR